MLPEQASYAGITCCTHNSDRHLCTGWTGITDTQTKRRCPKYCAWTSVTPSKSFLRQVFFTFDAWVYGLHSLVKACTRAWQNADLLSLLDTPPLSRDLILKHMSHAMQQHKPSHSMLGKTPTCLVSTDVLTSHSAMEFWSLALHKSLYMGKHSQWAPCISACWARLTCLVCLTSHLATEVLSLAIFPWFCSTCRKCATFLSLPSGSCCCIYPGLSTITFCSQSYIALKPCQVLNMWQAAVAAIRLMLLYISRAICTVTFRS